MNKKRVAAMTIAFSIILMGALGVSFVYSYWMLGSADPIVLPPDTSEGVAGSPTPGSDVSSSPGIGELLPVTVDTENVQNVVSTLTRIDSYQAEVETTLFWSGGNKTTLYSLWAREGFVRIDRGGADAPDLHYIVGGQWIFTWEPDGIQHQGRVGQMTGDDLTGVPTYETLLKRDPGQIVEADTRNMDGMVCVYAACYDEQSGYTDRYWVDVDSGLLVRSETDYMDQVIATMRMTSLQKEEPDQSLFRLPTGQLAMEVE